MIFSLIFLISIFLYIIAPDDYSFSYCMILHVLFIINAFILLYKDRKYEKIGFNLIFTVSFYFVNFVYPVFIYPIDSEYSLFTFSFNTRVISVSTALAQVAYSCYCLGFSLSSGKTNSAVKSLPILLKDSAINTIFFLTLIVFLAFLSSGGLRYYLDTYHIGVETTYGVSLPKYLITLLNPLMLITSILIFCTDNRSIIRRIFILALVVIFLLLYSGSRTLPLAILIIIFLYLVKRYKLSTIQIYMMILLGVVSLSLVGLERGGKDVDLTYAHQWYHHTRDLIVNNRNLYVAYDYVKNFGILWGIPLLGPIMSTIPFSQSFVVNLFGIPSYMLSSPTFITYLEFGEYPPLGLGSNIVGDIYLSLGFVGVLIAFYALGKFIHYSRSHMYRGNIYYLIIYCIMTSGAIYMCRDSYFHLFKTIVWAVMFVWLFGRMRTNVKMSK